MTAIIVPFLSSLCVAVAHELGDPLPFFISSEKKEEIIHRVKKKGLESFDERTLMSILANSFATLISLPPISNFCAGAALRDSAGNLYIGANVEFSGFPLNCSIHAEQFAFSNFFHRTLCDGAGTALLFTDVATSPSPCGHCRQFLREFPGSSKLQVHISSKIEGDRMNIISTSLLDLLPFSFSPSDLHGEKAMEPLCVLSDSDVTGLINAAADTHGINRQTLVTSFSVFQQSLAPYSLSPASVTLICSKSKYGVDEGTQCEDFFCGAYLENAAFNPSLSPLHSAIIALLQSPKKFSFEDIKMVVLIEKESPSISHANLTKEMVRSLSPHATLIVLSI